MFSNHWQHLAEMNRLRNEMDRLFGRFGATQGSSQTSYPALNTWEDDDNLMVEAELPGYSMEDLELFVSGGNQLAIRGERNRPEMGEGVWHREERSFGSFSRLVELPYPVDADHVDAEMDSGVLRITMPKAEEAKPRRISVKAS